MSQAFQPTAVLSDRLQFTDLPEMIDLLLESRKVRLTIEGFSMYPTLHAGDFVEVDPVSKEDLTAGDIVVFHKENKLICHRLVEIFEKDSKKWIRTQGDFMPHPDPPLSREELLGKVVSIERKGNTRVPSRKISRPLPGDILVLFINRIRVVSRNALLRLQSLRPFRLLYRLAFRPSLSYLMGLPVVSGSPSRFFRYFPFHSEEKEKYLASPDGGTRYRFLAKVKEDIVGSLEINAPPEKDSPCWSISHLFVRTRFRGCRIASTLLKQSFQLLRRKEALLLSVEVLPQNHPALSLFKTLGFSATGAEGTSQQETVVLQKEFPDIFPPLTQKEAFKENFIKNAARHLLLERALFEIDTAFKAKRIDFLVLKGMALAYLLYPDPAVRSMSDIDLYIHKKDIPFAAEVLKSLRYQMVEEEFKKELMTFGGELAFQRTNSPLIELHWCLEQYERLKGIVRIEEEALWHRAVSYKISEKTFKTLCPEHQLLSLSIHLGLVHRFEGLKWFLDIDQWVLKMGNHFDWEELFQTAKRWGIRRVVNRVLFKTQKLFDTPLPLSPDQKYSFCLTQTPFQWLLVDRFNDQIHVLFRIFFPSREWLIYRYRLRKRNRVFLYRLLHPLFVLLGKTR